MKERQKSQRTTIHLTRTGVTEVPLTEMEMTVVRVELWQETKSTVLVMLKSRTHLDIDTKMTSKQWDFYVWGSMGRP